MPHDTHGHMPCPHEHQKYQMFMISSVSSVGLIAVQGTVCLLVVALRELECEFSGAVCAKWSGRYSSRDGRCVLGARCSSFARAGLFLAILGAV